LAQQRRFKRPETSTTGVSDSKTVRLLRNLKAPPSNRLEALKGRLDGTDSIRVNDQYRIIFRFDGGNAHHIRCGDYH